ncbi:hypothetical protein H6F51_12990 [Cyanobacteria bacterium FACHB-DQ100]|nr:hypothetical protein [Cyanobacteria bacterium FACHB-DQ100]
MFAKDRFHGIVKTALQKEGWTITRNRTRFRSQALLVSSLTSA